MLAIYGVVTIAIFLVLIMTRRMSVITALVLVPVVIAFIAGFGYKEIGAMALTGIKQVAPTGILLMFAVLFFSVMLDAGLFDPVIAIIIRSVKGDPLKVIVGTAILTMFVHLDGDGTATFMIVLSAFFPIYKRLGINRLMLAGIVALSVGPMHLVPWSGTSVRAMSTLNTDALHMFNPNIPAMLGGIVWVLFVAYIFGKKERKRLGIVQFDYEHKENLTEAQRTLRRPKCYLNRFTYYCIIDRGCSCTGVICYCKHRCTYGQLP
jgi:CitMHS family citrate-Mg2+:H+ or citrate-Ca2+:H+ symporter